MNEEAAVAISTTAKYATLYHPAEPDQYLCSNPGTTCINQPIDIGYQVKAMPLVCLFFSSSGRRRPHYLRVFVSTVLVFSYPPPPIWVNQST